MTLTDIEGALHRVPFLPFNICLENGRVLQVPHPDFLSLDANQHTAVVAEGSNFRVIDLEQIVSLTLRSD
jgi:hypothetical protein